MFYFDNAFSTIENAIFSVYFIGLSDLLSWNFQKVSNSKILPVKPVLTFPLLIVVLTYIGNKFTYRLRLHFCQEVYILQKQKKYRRFAMKHPNDMVQMDILGPFYIHHQSSARNYIISCIVDDCSRKVASKCSERKRSIDVLDVLEEWITVG